MSGPRKAKRQRVLDPLERFSEVLFGLIMALTFTGAISAASSGREEVRTMIFGAIGCNLAWGLVDGVMYLLNTLAVRGQGIGALQLLRRTPDQGEAHRLIADALPPLVASVLQPAELEAMRRKLVALPLPARAGLRGEDFLAAFAVLVLVFLSTFPVVIPFFFVQETVRALRLSNGIALAMLFGGGWALGRYSGHRPIVMGLSMVGIGVVLVAITMALGG
jgi:hypothetical protein